MLNKFSIICDRILFYLIYRAIYKKKFKFYGDNIKWGRDFKFLIIPKSIRVSCPERISIGNNVQIDDGVYLQCDSNNINSGIEIGDRTRINASSHILSGSFIKIEKEVLIAPFTLITSNNHCYKGNESIMNQGMRPSGEIIIKKGAWLCQRSTVLGGSIVGEGAVIGVNVVLSAVKVEDRGIVKL